MTTRLTIKRVVSPNGYGVRMTGVSGGTIMWFSTRRRANCMRTTLREYKRLGGWTGWATLEALAKMVAEQPQCNRHIASDFMCYGRQLRDADA